MNIIKVFTFLAVSVVLASHSIAGRVPEPLKDVKVTARVAFDNASGIYSYDYEVYNPPTNTSRIRSFAIDVNSGPQDAPLSKEGLFNGLCYHKYGAEYSFQQTKMVPVGMDAPPGFMTEFPNVTIWSCDLSIMGYASWGSSDEPYRIFPGNNLEGFVLTSYGLPGIRNVIIRPGIDYDNLPDEYWENLELTKQLQDSLIYRTKTLGPTAPPADFKPLNFLDYIISMKHEAFQLGWIKNAGIENSLDKKLDSAKKSLEKGSTTSAKNILNAFVNEVEAQGCATYDNCPEGKHLTPEAYGLLKYNAEYLLERL